MDVATMNLLSGLNAHAINFETCIPQAHKLSGQQQWTNAVTTKGPNSREAQAESCSTPFDLLSMQYPQASLLASHT